MEKRKKERKKIGKERDNENCNRATNARRGKIRQTTSVYSVASPKPRELHSKNEKKARKNERTNETNALLFAS